MGGGRTVEKPANFGNVMGKLVHYCRNYLPVIIIALVLGAVTYWNCSPSPLRRPAPADPKPAACATLLSPLPM